MTTALFGYKCLLCLVYFVVDVICAIDAETAPSGNPTLMTAYSDGGFCIANWWPHNQSCYLFTTEKYNFTEANEHCSKQGAHLVSINNDAENEFITSKSDSTDLKWIGLYRETGNCVDISSCAWMWLDESSSGYYNWPIGSIPTPSLCAILEPNGFWSNRIRCSTKLAFICERGLWCPTTTPGFCIDNWWPHSQSCYLFMEEKYNFTEATERCSEQGAHLVLINDEAENEFITSKSDSTDPKWIGLYRETGSCVDISSCAWMWLDESSSGYYNWPIGSLPTPSLCAILEPNGFWSNRISCATKLPFICERGLWYLTTTPEATTMVMTTDKADHSPKYSTIDEVPSLEPNNEDTIYSITYIGVGVFLGIIVAAGIVGLVVYFKRCSRQMKNNKATDVNQRAGADYENVDMSSSSNDLVIDQPSMSIRGVYENTLASDTPSRSNNRVDDTGNHPFYERVTYDTEVSPEYARLQFTQSTHTNDSY